MLKFTQTTLLVLFVHVLSQGQVNTKDSFVIESPFYLHTESGVIAGTLTKPVQSSNIPVALIIAGSGPTDRNGNNAMMMNGNLKKLAYALARNNIASVRYDKRGIHESARAAKQEWNLRFEDYVADAAQWIEMLKRDKRFSKVIVIGHGEGSLVGMLAAEEADAFVSVEGAGRSADKILKEQLKSQPLGIQQRTLPIIDSLVQGLTVSEVDPLLHSLFRPSVQPYLISWFKYDPSVQIKKLKIPILIIQGARDLQVSVEDANLLAASSPTARLVVFNNMNHIFRNINGGRSENMASYNNDAAPISADLVKSIADFMQNNTAFNPKTARPEKNQQ
jgi:pimeloyl-ACP methyl ester carboxylesterase